MITFRQLLALGAILAAVITASVAIVYMSLNYHATLRRQQDTQLESLRSNLGLRLISIWRVGTFQVIPELRASWQHEFKYSVLPITAQFASGADGKDLGNKRQLAVS